MPESEQPERIKLTEEELAIAKREVERGRVVVRTPVEERDELAEIALRREDVTVERVPVGLPVDVAPAVREEDGVLIVPILEEQVVIETRLVLKEEIRITRKSRTELVREPVRLRSQRAEVVRLEGRDPDFPNPKERNPIDDKRTLTAMYDTRGAAESARDDLVALGVSSGDVVIHGSESGSATTSTTTEDRGFWGSLADFFVPEEDRYTYAEGVRRGGYLLSARIPEDMEEPALDVLERSGAVDIDEQAESWRQAGWRGYEASERRSDLPTGDGRTALTEDEGVLRVAEEELRVGKREVGRGSVRVRSYIIERPVEEQVALRNETVRVERRPVDRPLEPGDAAFVEREIEAVERDEEAVVSKQARVVEEIALRKDVDTRTETVRDTVRKQEVEVEDDRTARDVAGTDETIRRDRTKP